MYLTFSSSSDETESDLVFFASCSCKTWLVEEEVALFNGETEEEEEEPVFENDESASWLSCRGRLRTLLQSFFSKGCGM